MDGVINIFKPPGMTSMDVISVLRKIVREKKGGHIGTLDPGVSGVLPVFMGKATRAIHYIQDGDKKYRGEVTLGITTDTQDSEGEIIDFKGCTLAYNRIEKAVFDFIGKSLQMPPMYSAKKVNGIKLIDMAREGVEVDRKKREIEIDSLDIIRCKNDFFKGRPIVRILFDVTCSRGTYIRTLCHDIGEKLGCGGHMSFLERTASGSFAIEDTFTIEEVRGFSEKNQLDTVMITVHDLFLHLPEIYLNEKEKRNYLNGHRLILSSDTKIGFNRVLDHAGQFVGLGMVSENEGTMELKIEKQFLI